MTNLELFFKRKLTFIMDGIPKFAKEDTKLTVNIDEIENEVNSELEDNVPNWIAKAYGSKTDKKSFYDPRELVSLQNSWSLPSISLSSSLCELILSNEIFLFQERRKSYAGYSMVGTTAKRSSSNSDLGGIREEQPRRHSQTDIKSKDVYSYNLKGDPTIDAKTVSAWVAIGYGNSDTDYYEAYSEKLLNSKRLGKNE